MKRLCLILIMLCVGVTCRGAIILDDGLLLQGGQERIEMRVGERVYLRVQDSIWKFPVLKNLEYDSQNHLIAYVDRYGWIHGQSAGTTMLSVWNDRGDNGNIEVIVRRGVERRRIAVICVSILLLGALIVFCIAPRFRCFE